MKSVKNLSKQSPLKPQTLLQQLAQTPDKLFNGKFRQQYAALCYRHASDREGIEILVITSRDSGRWVIPKGWPMKKRNPMRPRRLRHGRKRAYVAGSRKSR